MTQVMTDARTDAQGDLTTTMLAEPALAVNLYPAPGASLDSVISGFLPAFLQRSRDEPEVFAWFLRHNARGEHLKLRIHCAAEAATSILGELEQAATRDPNLSTGPGPATGVAGAALEAADREPGVPERAVVRTEYERHAAVFDDAVLARDEEASSLFQHCLAAGTELVLRFFDAGHSNLHSHRQNVLIRLLGLGLSSVCRNADEVAEYLEFHRAWMIRFPVLWSGYGKEKARQVLTLYRSQTEHIPEAALRQLRAMLLDAPAAGEPTEESSAERRFQQALRRFVELVESPSHVRKVGQPDPFAEGPRSPALLKVFHTLANQLGIAKVDEGFIHHLLLVAIGKESGTEISLAPLIDADVDEQTSKAFTPKVAAFEEDYSWVTYVLASCTDPAWEEAFRRHGQGVFDDCGRALMMLRKGQTDAAKELLDEVEQRRRDIQQPCVSLFEGLGRFYYGTLAYYYYLVDDQETAVALLREAEQSVARAISEESFLTPMAPLVSDIPLQKARVARRLKQWQKMETHLLELRDFLEDKQPLCTLDDGSKVTHETLGQFFASLDLSAVEGRFRQAIDALVDPAQRRSEFRRRYAELYAPRFRLLPFP